MAGEARDVSASVGLNVSRCEQICRYFGPNVSANGFTEYWGRLWRMRVVEMDFRRFGGDC
jgi:hypothetical protein